MLKFFCQNLLFWAAWQKNLWRVWSSFIKPNKIILSFPVNLWKFLGSFGRKNNFSYRKKFMQLNNKWKRRRSRTTRDGNSSVLLPDCHPWQMSHDLILWRHDVYCDVHILASPYIIWDRSNQKSMEIIFWPRDLDLWPWPSNLTQILSRSMCLPIFKPLPKTVQLWECWITDTHTHTHAHTHTDGTDSITSTADAGGNKIS